MRYGRTVVNTTSDPEGYFHVELEDHFYSDQHCPDQYYPVQPVEIRLLQPRSSKSANTTVLASYVQPTPKSRFGVISDIDDTVMTSHTSNLVKTLALTLFRNAHSREPLEGVPQFYRKLRDGLKGDEGNPFFYISSSSWNIYDLIEDFIRPQRTADRSYHAARLRY